MKYEPFIIQVIRYNLALRKEIIKEIRKGLVEEPEYLLDLIRTIEGLEEISIPLRVKNNKELVFEQLFNILWEITFGKKPEENIIDRPLTKDDFKIFFDGKFSKILNDFFLLDDTQDEYLVLATFFDTEEIREILIEHDLINEDDELKIISLLGKLLDNRDTLINKRQDIWAFLSNLINPEVEEELSKKEILDCEPHEVLKKLALLAVDSEPTTIDLQTKSDSSQGIDAIAITFLKSEINGIIQAYHYHLNESLKELGERQEDTLATIIFSSYQYYINRAYHDAIEKLVLSNKDKLENILDEYLTSEQFLDYEIEKIAIQLSQFFILSGLEVPDPFSFKALFNQKLNIPKYENVFTILLTPKQVSEDSKRKYEEEYGEDGFEYISFCN